MAFIEILNLRQNRDKRDTLKNVNLKVERGEVFALIGPTGAGKTTLLRLIDLLDTPAAGKIIIDGIDTSLSEKARLAMRRRMAFVFQKPVVFNLSVYDNIAHGLKWRGLDRQQIREKVNAILETSGLTGYGHRNARTLSGGEVQRVAIARAIATEPEVLLLDEPTANLDPVSSAKIEELVSGIIKQKSITVVMATHDMGQGQRLADKMGVLVNGEVVQTGTAREIFATPMNREVAELVGMDNLIDGSVTACAAAMAVIDVKGKAIEAVADFEIGAEVSVCFRPEDVTVASEKLSSSARNSLAGTVSRVAFNGPFCRLEIDCGFPVVALVTTRSAEEMGLEKGAKVFATIKAVNIHVIKRH